MNQQLWIDDFFRSLSVGGVQWKNEKLFLHFSVIYRKFLI